MFLCNTDDDPERESTYLRLLRRHHVGGLVAASGTGKVDGQRIVEHLVNHGVPVVTVSGGEIHQRVAIMTVDDLQGERAATSHLLDLGHRRIGIITGPPGHTVTEARLAGYRAALGDRAVPLEPELVVPGAFTIASGQAGARRLMGLAEPPTALVAANDLAAIGAISVVKGLGKRVPDDLAVVGYDDIEMAALYDPPLTTIAQPLYAMGAAALQAILDRIGDPSLGGGVTTFETRLIVRASTVSGGAADPATG